MLFHRNKRTSAAAWLRPNSFLLAVALLCGPALAPRAAGRQAAACAAPGDAAARAEELSARWNVSALRKALDLFGSARECWAHAAARREEAGALKRIGDLHLSLSEYVQAADAYRAALSLWRELGDRQAEAATLVELSRAVVFTTHTDEALQGSREAAAIARSLGDRRLEARAENAVGKFYYRRGDFREAAAHYARALDLAREAGDPAEEAQALNNVGQVHNDGGELPEALSCHQRALPLWRAAKDRRGEVRTLTAIGLTYSLLGESQTALEYLDRMALPSLREAGDRTGEAAAHNNIGYVYHSLGDYGTALSHYREALAIFDQVDIPVARALTSVYVGEVSALLGRVREAREHYERAVALSRAQENPLLEADALNGLGQLLLSGGGAGEAYESFRQALSAYEKAGHQRGQAAALNGIGWYFGGRGDWRGAAGHFRRALEFCRTAGDQLGESQTLYNIALADYRLGADESARANIEAGLRITESLRTRVTSSELRASYFASAHRQFELYVAVLMRLHGRDHAAPFEASERGRARSLLETLAEARAEIRRGVDPDLLRRERELQLRLNAKVERRVRLPGDRTTRDELAEAEREIDALAAERRQLQGLIRASSPRYAALVQPAPLSLREIQRRVPDAETVLLEYALGEERSFVWAVTPDSIKSFELPARAEVERAARRVYELLTARNRRPKGETAARWQARVRGEEAEYDAAAAALGRMILEPVAAELAGKRVAVVADGALQYVPFAALPDPAGRAEGKRTAAAGSPRQAAGGPAPLIAGHEVVVLPSASVLALMREELRGRPPAPRSVAVLADPVFDSGDERLAASKGAGVRGAAGARAALRGFDGPDEDAGLTRLLFSRREANAIMASVPTGDGMLSLGFDASLATATSAELARYRVVHFATHGLLNSEHPELSGVVLSLFDAGGRRRDGFLQSHEIYNLELPADLVVLSACQTALGKEVRGEGLVGLTRGFMYAGAARVVASLWKVDDAATAELMGEFYRAMFAGGLRPAAALRAAQVHMWRQNRWRSPYYWAAFTLQGEWR
jgi:CHAT domain-containing protein